MTGMVNLGRYVFLDLIRNNRRTLSTVAGVFLGIALTCAVLFFVDGLSASMTQRAVEPLQFDMQRIVTTAPSGTELVLSYEPSGYINQGEIITIHLGFKNSGVTPANEVVLRSVPGSSFDYTPESARINGEVVAGEENPFAHGLVKEGFNIGTVSAGESVIAQYQVIAGEALTLSDQDFKSSFSTREILTPISANVVQPLSLEEILGQIRNINGVAFAEQLYIADLQSGSLLTSDQITGPIRVFGFDDIYLEHDPTVVILEGEYARGAAMVSAEAAKKGSIAIGDNITLSLPDGSTFTREVSGIVDLTRSRALYGSRNGADLEVFIYKPNTVIIDTESFSDELIHSFVRAQTTKGERVKSLPIQEIDLQVERERLNAEPSMALKETKKIAQEIAAISEGQGYVLDHISNTLAVAQADANTAKQMFVFLGSPGILLAALLASYAGIVLSSAQRREQATLRVRGASRKHLLSMLTLRVSCITASGALIGVGLGFLSVVQIIGLHTLLRATLTSLLISALFGVVSGVFAIGSALYVTGKHSIEQEINADRAKFVSNKPVWQTYWIDVIGIVFTIVVTFYVLVTSGFEGTPGSVYVGRSVHISLWLLILPIMTWIFGILFGGRIVALLLSHIPFVSANAFKSPLRLLFIVNLRRRFWPVTEAAIIIGLIIALGMSLAVFTASYQEAKISDARYVVGSDIKISTTPASNHTYKSVESSQFAGNGIDGVTPVVYGIHNAIIRSNRTSDVANLAALDPQAYSSVAPINDDHFVTNSSEVLLDTIGERQNAILLSTTMADLLRANVGDQVHVLLARGTSDQVEVVMEVAGLFDKLPGFPDGADALIDIKTYESAVPASTVSFFLAKTEQVSDKALEQVVQGLQEGVVAENELTIDTRRTALAKDQSSLAALNIGGLLKIDSSYSLAMGTMVVTIFVFGLLLSRRREYVTLKSQGMSSRDIRALIRAEAVSATIAGSCIGVPVGLIMAYYFINVLRPLFVLNPPYVVPLGSLAFIIGSVLIAAIVASTIASSIVYRLKPTELLRDE